jgi:MFS transporter, YNFM family, putative membrane transport protein
MTTGRRARSMRWFIYAIIGLLVVTQLLALCQFAVWIPLHGPLSGTFPQASRGLAAVGSSFALAYAAGSLVAGPITDRHGRWPILTGALLGLSATTLVAAVSTTWLGYLAARGAQGLAAAAIPVAASSWVSDTLSPRGFATTEAVFTAAANQGAVQVGQLWGQLVGPAGWRATFAGLAAAYALAALVLLAALALRGAVLAPRMTPGPDARMGAVLRRALGLTRQPPLVLCWTAAGLLLGALLAMYAGLEYFGYDHAVLLRLRLWGLAGAAAAPLALAALPAVRPGWLALAGLAVSVTGLLTQAISGELPAITVGSALVAAGTTFALPPVAMLVVLLSADARASALAVYGCCLAVGASLGAELPGRVPAWLGYPGLCALVASALGVVALIFPYDRPGRPLTDLSSIGPQAAPQGR